MSWVRAHCELPVTPDGAQLPQSQLVVTAAMAVLVAGASP